jgi:dihydroorotate dehydrogenase electron transfer subunit
MKEKAFLKKFRIIANKNICGNYFKISFAASDIASSSQPGQFVMVQVNRGVAEPLLRRPMSIHSVKKDKIEILYEVLGRGTQILSRKKSGEYLDVVGPLGNGFEITDADIKNTILVAGGMGVAPLLFLAERLWKRKSACVPPHLLRRGRAGRQNAKRKNSILIGAKTKNNLFCEKEFKELGCDVKIATDDGSKGFKGQVSELLEQIISNTTCRVTGVYACGPAAMLKGISYIASKYGISAWGSFEAHMACGIGACMGCVIKVQNTKAPHLFRQAGKTQNDFVYKRVCNDGPVFALNQVIWGGGVKNGK